MRTLLAIVLMLHPLGSSASPLVDVGQPFPIIKLPLCGDEQAKTSVQEFRGRKLMLHLFASW